MKGVEDNNATGRMSVQVMIALRQGVNIPLSYKDQAQAQAHQGGQRPRVKNAVTLASALDNPVLPTSNASLSIVILAFARITVLLSARQLRMLLRLG